jgi:hypothetical protein
MTVETDEIVIGIGKLRLEPGDQLIVSVPDDWTAREIRQFEADLQATMPAALQGVAVLVVSELMRISVRKGDLPSADAQMLYLVPPAGLA